MTLKPRADRFEQKMTVKMIIERIIKALLKSKITDGFELIYSHGLLSTDHHFKYVFTE